MSRLVITAGIAIGAGALAAWTGYVAWSAPTPGPLTRTHAGVAELEGGDDCSQCHGDDGMTASCLDCHGEIAAQYEARSGYHFQLREDGHEDCASCHGEHYGPEYTLVNDRTWSAASPGGFAHEHVEFNLVDAHQDLECETCHDATHADASWPAYQGRPRTASFLGLGQECRQCHDDVHGLDGTRDCASCHDQAVFDPASLFDHDESFPLVGSHTRTACDKCHIPDAQSAKNLPFGTTAGQDCQSCHESPHTGPNEVSYGNDCAACHDPEVFTEHHYQTSAHTTFALMGEHLSLDCRKCHQELDHPLQDLGPETCQSCHASAHTPGAKALRLWDDADCSRCHEGGQWQTGTLAELRHAELEFPLVGGHQATDCRTCHDQAHLEQPVPGDACASCHDDPHRAEFPEDCNACHALAHPRFDGAASQFTLAQHASTDFPLRDKHQEASCGDCHQAAQTYAERFPGREPGACAICHDDPHAGQFQERQLECRQCHTEKAFEPSLWSLEDHQTFPILGNHRAVACIRCHPLEGADAPQQFVGTSQECAGCHEDYHRGVFQSKGKPTSCDVCHDFNGWPVTAFPHERLSENARCTACHDDPHQGQLTTEEAACQRCHQDFEAWAPTAFDHQTMSRYPLDGSHKDVSCERCHPRERREDRTLMVRYRPIGKECQDCHEAR